MVAENVGNLRFAFQTAKGTPATSSTYGLYLAGGTMPGSMPTHEAFEETTGAQMLSDRYVSEAHVSGAPEVFVPPNAAAALLYGTLGAVATTGAADPWSHAITWAATRPWMTWWRSLGGLIYGRNDDCKIDQLVISGESNKPLRMTATISGLTPRYADSEETTATVEITNRVLYYDGQGALQLEGSAIANIRQFTLTINRNGELVPGDSLNPVDNAEGAFEVSLAITKLFESASLYNRAHWGSATPTDLDPSTKTVLELGGGGVDFTFTRVAAAPGPERSLKLVVPRMALVPFDLQPSPGNSPLTEALTFEALQPSGGTSPVTATVKNGIEDLAVGA